MKGKGKTKGKGSCRTNKSTTKVPKKNNSRYGMRKKS